ncbi:hypothetical protein HYH02_012663 [Chlamydomonas schloesseri]|uniref:Uncharacterized protein n=1 Tax=Chlamydomonas schloesseri TaxID=2026947 RepID=A0A835SXG5_9CHLO|nr:hypothetical protein HYH02_012663 [Chlamydomonas schloesseri]|eukprot:KAG2433546.1 hypothetical protein HYH02_012663 [Chlamydomonas schloesseri]
MSKRAREAAKAAKPRVEVIDLLDSSDEGDDLEDPDLELEELEQEDAPPTKRLRRGAGNAASRPAPQIAVPPAAVRDAAAGAGGKRAGSGAAPRPTATVLSQESGRSASQHTLSQQQAAGGPKQLRQGTLAPFIVAPKRSTLPLQTINAGGQRKPGGASSGQPGPPHPHQQRDVGANSPSSERSQASQDEDVLIVTGSQGASQQVAGSQQPASQRPRQLPLALVRTADGAGPGLGSKTGQGAAAALLPGPTQRAGSGGGAAPGSVAAAHGIMQARPPAAASESHHSGVGSRSVATGGGSKGAGPEPGLVASTAPNEAGTGGAIHASTQRPGGAATANRRQVMQRPTEAGTVAPAAAPAAPAKLPSGTASGLGDSGMWHERHAPRNEEELGQVLHAKKVREVRDWLEFQRQQFASRAAANTAAMVATAAASAAARGGGGGGGRQGQPHPPQPYPRPRPQPCGVAILTGPAGCGKSSAVRVLGAALGFELVEWTPPPPLLWHEYQYQHAGGGYGGEYGGGEGSGRGGGYQSKLDDFEAFVRRAKFPALNLAPASSVQAAAATTADAAAASTRGSQGAVSSGAAVAASPPRPKLLLLEDLPHTHDLERRQRLAAALRDLAACARGPIVLIATEAEGGASAGGPGSGGGGDGGGSMGGSKGLHKDLLAALDAAGAHTISFNPVTANNIAKLLLRVAAAEGLELAPAAAVGLAEAADGDVRSALQSLQMHAMLQKAAAMGQQAADGGSGKGKGGKGGAGGRGGRGSKGRGGGSSRGGPSITKQLQEGRQTVLSAGEVARLAAAQRDLGLPLFHALGKFLHNKRGGPGGAAGGGGGDGGGSDDESGHTQAATQAGGGRSKSAKEDSKALQQLNAHALTSGRLWRLDGGTRVQLPARLQRPPMRYDPESIISRGGLEAPSLLAFLHENYPGFVSAPERQVQPLPQHQPQPPAAVASGGGGGGCGGGLPPPAEASEAVDDLATIAAYLSDSAVLCGQSRSIAAATAFGGTSIWHEDSPGGASLASAVAASVAARGVMFGNRCPARNRFAPIRAPAAFAIDTAASNNRLQVRMAAVRLAANPAAGAAGVASGAFGGSAADLVTGVVPWLRSLVQYSPAHAAWLAGALPGSWSYFWNGAITEGAFLRAVAQQPQYKQHQQGWQGQRPGQGQGQGKQLVGGVEGMMEQLGLEEEEDDPIED